MTPIEPPLLDAPPPRVPEAPAAPAVLDTSAPQLENPDAMIRYDVATATTTMIDASGAKSEASSGYTPAGDPLYETNWVAPDGSLPPAPNEVPETQPYAAPDYVFGADNRTLVGQGNMTVYPWRTIGRTWVIFPDGAEFSGTAEVIGSRTLLTAGHIVYDAAHGGWASQLYFSAGQDGNNVYDADWNTTFKRSNYQFYGEARALNFQSYTGWVNSGDWNYDMAFVALDRNIGSYTGWMGWGYNDNNSFFSGTTLNTAGYPGDLTPSAYDQWFTSGTLTSVNTLNFQTQIDTMPGQSGSPLWYYDGTNRTIYATNSSQWTSGGVPIYNQFTRITGPRFTDMQNFINGWGAATDQPDLVDYDQWFDSTFAFNSPTTATPGRPFNAHSYVRNNGTATAGSFRVDFYASTNTTISTGDYFIGSANVSSLASYNWADAIYNGAFPYIPDGNYYLGWIIDAGGSQSEYVENNNTGVIDWQWLTVTSPPDVGDTLGTARSTGLGLAGGNYYDFNPIGNWFYQNYDVDLYQFQGGAGATVTIDTSLPFGGVAMDTIVRLFDQNGNQIAVNDDIAPGFLYSHLSATLPTTGTYYVGVSGYSNFSYSPFSAVSGTSGSTGEYDLALSLTPTVAAPRIGGSAITFDSTIGVHAPYVVPTGNGEQVRTVPVGSINQISIDFDQDVTVTQGALTLTGAGSYSFNNFVYDPVFDTATWTLAAPLPAGTIALHLADTVNTGGLALDGEWDNPTGLFDPSSSTLSGNGLAGGAFEFRFTVLPGDANRDNQVTGADYTLWADNYEDWAGGATTSVGDFNGDGLVTGADYTIWADHYGDDLQAPEASTPPTSTPALLAPLRTSPRLVETTTAEAAQRRSASGSLRRDRTAAIDDVLADWEAPRLEAALAVL